MNQDLDDYESGENLKKMQESMRISRMNCERLDGVASLLNPDALSADFNRSQMLNI